MVCQVILLFFNRIFLRKRVAPVANSVKMKCDEGSARRKGIQMVSPGAILLKYSGL